VNRISGISRFEIGINGIVNMSKPSVPIVKQIQISTAGATSYPGYFLLHPGVLHGYEDATGGGCSKLD
jgi:hypothetical protein